MEKKFLVRSINECIEISRDNGETWDYITYCCDSLSEIFSDIASYCGIDYERIEESR